MRLSCASFPFYANKARDADIHDHCIDLKKGWFLRSAAPWEEPSRLYDSFSSSFLIKFLQSFETYRTG